MKNGVILNKSFLVLACLVGMVGCSEPQHQQEKNKAEHQNAKMHDVFELPNKQTTYETIAVQNVPANTALFTALENKLALDHFQIVEKEHGRSWSEADCVKNKIIYVKGDGIRSYLAKSSKPIGKNTYPDFVLLVFSLDDENKAAQHFTTLQAAVDSMGGYCNGKSPEKIVRSGSEIFYFTTRAEAFRTHINQYADFVANFENKSP